MALFYQTRKLNSIVIMDSREDRVEPYSEAYLDYKRRCNESINTLKDIASALIIFLGYLVYSNVQIEEISKLKYIDQVRFVSDYQSYLKQMIDNPSGHTRNNETCNTRVNQALSFLEFTCFTNNWLPLLVRSAKEISYRDGYGIIHYRTVNKYDGLLPKCTHEYPEATREQVENMISKCKSKRDIVLINVLYDTGVRIGEALGIHPFEDIDFDRNTIYVRYRTNLVNGAAQKNAEERPTYISEETKELILVYISENADVIGKTEFLFNNEKGKNKGKPMTINAANKLFARLMERIGSHVTPHMIRHLFANERRKDGWTLLELMTALGHKKIETTEKYLHVTDEETRKAADRFYQNNKAIYSIRNGIDMKTDG